MTKQEFDALLIDIQAQERAVRDDGQKEYAHDVSNVFANFEAAAEELGGTRELDLIHLALKHWRGICAWIKGHRSQREDIRGRLKDLRLYLALLWGMVEEDETRSNKRVIDAIDSKLPNGGSSDGRVKVPIRRQDDLGPIIGYAYQQRFTEHIPNPTNPSVGRLYSVSDKFLCTCLVQGKITDDTLPYNRTVVPYGLDWHLADMDCEICHGTGLRSGIVRADKLKSVTDIVKGQLPTPIQPIQFALDHAVCKRCYDCGVISTTGLVCECSVGQMSRCNHKIIINGVTTQCWCPREQKEHTHIFLTDDNIELTDKIG